MNTNILGQEMAYAAMRAPKSYTTTQVKIWKERRNLIYQGLVDLGLDLWKPEGAFYVFPKFADSNRVVNDLFYDHRMITYDGAWFGDPTRVRFSYALDVSKIKEGLRRLKKYMTKRGLLR
jgi:aspartate/methionine/tyrosine aminotransferase